MKIQLKRARDAQKNDLGYWFALGLPEGFAATVRETTSWQQQLGSQRSWSYKARVYGHGYTRRSNAREPGEFRSFASKRDAVAWIMEMVAEIETERFRSLARNTFRKAA